MSGQAASIENFGIDPDAIIANAQREVQLSIGNFYFYILRLRVTERVAQGLAGEAIELGRRVTGYAVGDRVACAGAVDLVLASRVPQRLRIEHARSPSFSSPGS